MNKRSYPMNYPRPMLVQSLNLNEERISTSRYASIGPLLTQFLDFVGKVDSCTRFSREKTGIFEGRVGVRANS